MMPNIHESLDQARQQCEALAQELGQLRDARVSAEEAARAAVESRLEVAAEVTRSLQALDSKVDDYIAAATAGIDKQLGLTAAALEQTMTAITAFSESRWQRLRTFVWVAAGLNTILFCVLLAVVLRSAIAR